ncbi:TetR/AcrR family transcriptional regulator [Paenibacillus tritici]|uniref:TetR/AcrR family transcriptional regulator n=1 Tax=Paenibacillus tritici TaxID=1873425 RepID=A0ABX2DNX0_9BACL|nr:TetR/AcrR family transcriptional regulator [Paenibacillus tritici]NQX45814.1 TetR/AcrR family transcriptional regulator [Paenibacillus tritici]QUL53952.1 TetR/AcrR family transcriptional regulator [Paenibacillus tritici]
MDRRIGKTRDAIFKAFISLMAEKNFEQITVNEIAERANVSRGTIYLHFVDKYDLLNQCIEQEMTELCNSCMNIGGNTHLVSSGPLLRTAEYLERHAFVFTTLLNNNGISAFRTRLHTILLQGLSEQIDMTGLNRGMNKEMLQQFLASAVVGVMEWWITHSMPYPAKELIEDILVLMERNQMAPRQLDSAQ